MKRTIKRIPPLKKYDSAKSFFQDFYQVNQPDMTHRSFAMEICWPSSLLGDIMQGRKPLTVNRAVEFANFMKLNSIQCEHLIILALKEVDNSGVQAYATTYLETEGASLNYDPEIGSDTHDFVSADVYGDVEYMVLHAFLTWSKGEIDLERLPSYLPAFPKFRDREFVANLLARMGAEGVIEGAAPKIKILKKNLLAPNPVAARKNYLESFQRVCDLTPEKVDWSAGSVIFPKKQISELNERIKALTHWVLMTASREEPDETSDPAKHTILQLDLSVFEILEP